MAVVNAEDAATAIANDLVMLLDQAPLRIGARPKADLCGVDGGAPLASVWFEPPAEADEAASQLVVVGHVYARRSPRAKWELTQVITARGADAFALSSSQAECMLGADNPEEEPISVVLNFAATPIAEAEAS